ncbi:MAG: hypothetical protein K0B11_12970 [Mariniphaga sp.]|nr:hypothetical protein [Mariniphaga sp.]
MNFRKFLFTVLVMVLGTGLLTAQVNAPSPYPDRVVLNLTENPATSVAVTWRTDVSVSEGFCELQPASEGPVKKEDSKSFKAKTTTIKYENRDNKHLRENFQPILEKYKVDLVLSGHDHSYGRGRYTDNPANSHKVMYVVSVSGPKMYEAGDKDWMEHSGAFKQLYQVISIDGNELNYESFTADGELFDRFSLKKKKNGKTKFTGR